MADLGKKAGAFAGRAAGKAKNFALFTVRKTRDVSRIARLNVEIASERDSIKRNYSEIGKLYYEIHRDAPEGFFVQLCQEIDTSLASISAMESEIAHLKLEEGEVPGGEEQSAESDENGQQSSEG